MQQIQNTFSEVEESPISTLAEAIEEESNHRVPSLEQQRATSVGSVTGDLDYTKLTTSYYPCDPDEALYCPLYYLLKLNDIKTPVNTYDFDHLRCGGRFQQVRRKYLPLSSATQITFNDLLALSNERDPLINCIKPDKKPLRISACALISEEGYRIHDYLWELTERGKKVAQKAKADKWIRTQRKSFLGKITPSKRKHKQDSPQSVKIGRTNSIKTQDKSEEEIDPVKALEKLTYTVRTIQEENKVLRAYVGLLEPMVPSFLQLNKEPTFEAKIRKLQDMHSVYDTTSQK